MILWIFHHNLEYLEALVILVPILLFWFGQLILKISCVHLGKCIHMHLCIEQTMMKIEIFWSKSFGLTDWLSATRSQSASQSPIYQETYFKLSLSAFVLPLLCALFLQLSISLYVVLFCCWPLYLFFNTKTCWLDWKTVHWTYDDDVVARRRKTFHSFFFHFRYLDKIHFLSMLLPGRGGMYFSRDVMFERRKVLHFLYFLQYALDLIATHF